MESISITRRLEEHPLWRVLHSIKREVPLSHPLRDGLWLSGLLSALIVASLKYNPRIWQGDAPRVIQERAGPMSEADKGQRLVVAIPFLGLMFGFPVYSNLRLRRRNGGTLQFASAFANTYAIAILFGLVDLLLIDYLLIVRLRANFVVLPGTEDMDEYGDFGLHLRGFFKGLGFGLVYSLVVAWLTSRKA